MIVLKLFLSSLLVGQYVVAQYNVGVGIADITGSPVEVAMMGYAKLSQVGKGIHLRQYSRAFIFEQANTRLVFVSMDIGMTSTGLRQEVLKRLTKLYGTLYNETNVILSGTHTHSGPGGYNMYFLFDLSILGFVQQTFKAHVNGIVKSIKLAHENLTPAKIFYNEGTVENSNINRSPQSYLLNPDYERIKYSKDTDTKMVQIKFVSSVDNSILGAISWFAVHPTSMNNTNPLVSSDNMGYASILLEQAMNPKGTLPGQGKFVSAFASSNLGDVSPNIKGPKCEFSGLPCDALTSHCSKNEKCFASGPGKDMFESTQIIAQRIQEVGLKLLQTEPGYEINGPINVVHQYVNMPDMEVPDYDVQNERFIPDKLVKGCLPAMGYSFAAGTTDGPGEFNFTQGTKTGNPLWDSIRNFLATPTKEDIECQAPKPILLATGRMKFPYEWQPKILSTQLALLGDLVIAAIPGEFTTMSGRRMRSLLTNTFASAGKNVKVIIAGLSNTYSDYIVTPEEYQAQRYEAASTIYGPHTLTIHLHQYNELAKAIISNERVSPGPTPIDFSDRLITLVTPVIFDIAPWGHSFGNCIQEPDAKYTSNDEVHVKFVSGNPRNNLLTDATYLTVEKYDDNTNEWFIIATDSNWETKFVWERTSLFLGKSEVNIYWKIRPDTTIGTYRIKHYGYYRHIFTSPKRYEGVTRTFKVY
ncbi:neutral ceramidase-like [Arctopsyche grandis]|uniref:neutral ceramidase-like n=1 Tax=Arctopsyche grandis TaxID=121162 RepID=UPI00406D8ED1